jgi:glycosyltransferase involved in cell wall biosynthesis
MTSAYHDADAVIVPSRVEPFGNVAVEGLAAGRPVIASAVGGLPEIVTDRSTGRLVTPDDPTALANAILEVAEAPDVARRMGFVAATEARERFDGRRYQDDILAIAAELVGAPTRIAAP